MINQQNNTMAFGIRLRRARERAGLSQQELADILEVSQPAIVRWEKDQSSIRLPPLLGILKALNVSADELLSESEPDFLVPKRGPTSRLVACFREASKLPKKQQVKVTEVVDALVESYQKT